MNKLSYYIVAILFVMSCSTTKTTTSNKVTVPKYVKFSEFNNDTAAYIKQNFEARKQYYVGKKFKVLLNDLELPFKSAILMYPFYKYEGRVVVNKGVFYFYDQDKYYNATDTKDFIPGIIVRFAPPYVDKEKIDFWGRKYSEDWNKENRKILEKLIVESVEYYDRAQWRIKKEKK